MSVSLRKIVVVESPYNASTRDEIAMNIIYARACVSDAIHRGEIPLASHLFYTQPGILDDSVPEERQLGIDAGLSVGAIASKTVVYLDRGISRGMEYGIENAKNAGRPVEERKLGENWYDKFISRVNGHSQKEVWELSCK